MGIRRCFSLLPATASQNFHALRTRFPPHPIRVATTSSHSARKAHSAAGLPHIILVYLCKITRDGMNKYSRQLENTRVFSSDSPCANSRVLRELRIALIVSHLHSPAILQPLYRAARRPVPALDKAHFRAWNGPYQALISSISHPDRARFATS